MIGLREDDKEMSVYGPGRKPQLQKKHIDRSGLKTQPTCKAQVLAGFEPWSTEVKGKKPLCHPEWFPKPSV